MLAVTPYPRCQLLTVVLQVTVLLISVFSDSSDKSIWLVSSFGYGTRFLVSELPYFIFRHQPRSMYSSRVTLIPPGDAGPTTYFKRCE